RKRRDGRSSCEIGSRECGVKRFVRVRHADRVFAAVGDGGYLKLVGLREIRSGSSVSVDNAFGEKGVDALALIGRNIGGVDVVEAAVFAHDNDHMLDGTDSGTVALTLATLVLGHAHRGVQQQSTGDQRSAYRADRPPF